MIKTIIFFTWGTLILVMGSCGSSCTSENIDLIGKWDVEATEFIDDEGTMREYLESEGVSYEEYVEATKMMEQLFFEFLPGNKVVMSGPDDIGGTEELSYLFEPGSTSLTINDHAYDFDVTSCDAITLTDVALDRTTFLHMHCVRMVE